MLSKNEKKYVTMTWDHISTRMTEDGTITFDHISATTTYVM
jgi:hypothetical protein